MGDRTNLVHAGTIITYGRGRAVIVATGMRTEFGQIAALLEGVEADEHRSRRTWTGWGPSWRGWHWELWRWSSADGVTPLDDATRAELAGITEDYAHDALRVLAVAMKEHAELSYAEDGMTLLGLVGMIDPPRAEARDAIALCERAGIRTVMITGDHPATATATAVARELGLLRLQLPFGPALRPAAAVRQPVAELRRRLGDDPSACRRLRP